MIVFTDWLTFKQSFKHGWLGKCVRNFGHFCGCGASFCNEFNCPFCVSLTHLEKSFVILNEEIERGPKVKWFFLEREAKMCLALDEWVGHLGNFRWVYVSPLPGVLGGIYLSFSLFSCVHILIYRLIWDSRARAHDASSMLLASCCSFPLLSNRLRLSSWSFSLGQ